METTRGGGGCRGAGAGAGAAINYIVKIKIKKVHVLSNHLTPNDPIQDE
jgi:hypothetical protein